LKAASRSVGIIYSGSLSVYNIQPSRVYLERKIWSLRTKYNFYAI